LRVEFHKPFKKFGEHYRGIFKNIFFVALNYPAASALSSQNVISLADISHTRAVLFVRRDILTRKSEIESMWVAFF